MGHQSTMLAFEGIQVIDMTHVIAGPFSTYQLGVMGATIIKIENPSNPDMMRFEGVDYDSNKRAMGTSFHAQSANKLSVAVDIKTADGQEIIRKLSKESDVLVENYRCGSLENLGLGYKSLKTQNPGLIYCSLTGFGQTGPKSQHTAYDNVIQAFSGLMASTGSVGNSPVKVGPPVLDYGTGAQAAYAISAALFKRTRTGTGECIDVSMLDAALMFMSSGIADYQSSGKAPIPTGNSSATKPGYACYPTEEGLLMIGAWTPKQYARLWQVLGESEKAKIIDGHNPAEPYADPEEDRRQLKDLLSRKTAEDWEIILNKNMVPAARVRNLDEALNHAQVQSRQLLQDGKANNGRSVPVAAFDYAEEGPSVRSSAPIFAAHTENIMLKLGYSLSDIKSLSQRGVVAVSE